MSKKNLLLYLFFIFVIILVPGKVEAAKTYELTSPCHESRETDVWKFKYCQVKPDSYTKESWGFQFTEYNSYNSNGAGVLVTYKDDTAYEMHVCSSRKSNDNIEGINISGKVCDVYELKSNHKNKCFYKAQNGNLDGKEKQESAYVIEIDTDSDKIFKFAYWLGNGNNDYTYYKTEDLNFENFPYDGTCPATVEVAEILNLAGSVAKYDFGGDNWFEWELDDLWSSTMTGAYVFNLVNIDKSLVNNPDITCTDAEISKYKDEENDLYLDWRENYYVKYMYMIKNKDFSASNHLANFPERPLTPELKIDIISEYMERVSGGAETYLAKLEKLKEKYNCSNLPEIKRFCPYDEGCVSSKTSCQNAEDVEGCNACDVCQTCEYYPEGVEKKPTTRLICAGYEALKDLADEAVEKGDSESADIYLDGMSKIEETGKEVAKDLSDITEIISKNWGNDETFESNCTGILGSKLIEGIETVFLWVKILAPILLILFGSLDFAKAVFANDNDALKKATNDFVKRVIAAVAIFLLPTIINIVFDLEGLESLGVEDPLCNINLVVRK